MNAPHHPCCRSNRIQRPGFPLRTGGRPGRFLTPPVLGDAGAGGLGTPCITRVLSQPNPAFRLFPPDRREAGAFFDAAGSQRCGADSPARRVMDTPHHLCTAPSESITPVFFSGREESGRLFWGAALPRAGTFSRGVPQYVIYSPARQRAKNRQPLTHSGKQGLPAFVLGFLPHRGRGIGGLSPGWPGASCSDTGSCSVRYKPVHRHLTPPRESCAPADRCPANGGFPPG